MDTCKIKICGLSRFRDILAVNEALPDYIGFVFAKSSRRVTPDRARQLKGELDPRIRTVGVFVNAPMEEILCLTEDCGGQNGTIGMIQLHGDEDGAYIRTLKEHTHVPVIKAVRVQGTDQIQKAQELPCDYLLLDTYTRDAYGGMGVGFDWNMIPRLSKPFFLAGGICSGNLARAAALGPYCIDVSSGVETDGRKDCKKIRELVNLLRATHEYKESKGA